MVFLCDRDGKPRVMARPLLGLVSFSLPGSSWSYRDPVVGMARNNQWAIVRKWWNISQYHRCLISEGEKVLISVSVTSGTGPDALTTYWSHHFALNHIMLVRNNLQLGF